MSTVLPGTKSDLYVAPGDSSQFWTADQINQLRNYIAENVASLSDLSPGLVTALDTDSTTLARAIAGRLTNVVTLALASASGLTAEIARALAAEALSTPLSAAGGALVTATGSTTARSLAARFADVVNVKDFGAKGDGVTDDTAAIQAVRNAAAASPNASVVFPAGTYLYSASPNWAIQGLRMRGEGRVILKHTGSGNAWIVDGGAASTQVNDVSMEHLVISGNANSTNGLWLRAVHRSFFGRITVRNVSGAGLYTQFAVANAFPRFKVSSNEGAFTTVPVNGILLDRRGAAEQTTASEFTVPVIEGVSGSGIKLVYSSNNHFVAGTSEANGVGIEITSTASANVIDNLDCEANATADFLDDGAYTVIRSPLSDTLFHFTANATESQVIGGRVNQITIDNGARGIVLDHVHYGINAGAITDNGTGTEQLGCYSVSSNQHQPWSVAQFNSLRIGTPTVIGAGALSLKFDPTAQNGLEFQPSSAGGTPWLPIVMRDSGGTSKAYIFYGTGAPAMDAPIGSMFIRYDGGANSTLYLKQVAGSGGGNWKAL